MKGEHVQRRGLLVEVDEDGAVQAAEEEQRQGGVRFGRHDHRGHRTAVGEGEVGAVGDGAAEMEKV